MDNAICRFRELISIMSNKVEVLLIILQLFQALVSYWCWVSFTLIYHVIFSPYYYIICTILLALTSIQDVMPLNIM